jgi:DNA-directed RNA polymerase beta subunit
VGTGLERAAADAAGAAAGLAGGMGRTLGGGTFTDGGELALGRNVTVAFMPFWGLDEGNAVAVSERLALGGLFGSFRTETFLADAGDAAYRAEKAVRRAGKSPGPAGKAARRHGKAVRRVGEAPGLAEEAPGLAGDAPGLAGDAPGLAGDAPGLAEEAPGLAEEAPRRSLRFTRDNRFLTGNETERLGAFGTAVPGARVGPGDILASRVVFDPEPEPLIPELKLIRSVFGLDDVGYSDRSLRLPGGRDGFVAEVRIYGEGWRDGPSGAWDPGLAEPPCLETLEAAWAAARGRLSAFLEGRRLARQLSNGPDRRGSILLPEGHVIGAEDVRSLPVRAWGSAKFAEDGDPPEQLQLQLAKALESVISLEEKWVASLMEDPGPGVPSAGPPDGAVGAVRVTVAYRDGLEAGDVLADRHGSPMAVSRIVPEEDMPFMEDGTPVDLVVNPLAGHGLPAGRLMEAALGMAARELGRQLAELAGEGDVWALRRRFRSLLGARDWDRFCGGLDDEGILGLAAGCRDGLRVASPAFGGAGLREIRSWLSEAGLPASGAAALRDGRTGEAFEGDVAAGVLYVMKLLPPGDGQLQARSFGPCRPLTHEPTPGWGVPGGQLLDETGAWALAAHGAAWNLKELLGFKSDDEAGRRFALRGILKGNVPSGGGIPEIFRAAVKRARAAALDVEFGEAAAGAGRDGGSGGALGAPRTRAAVADEGAEDAGAAGAAGDAGAVGGTTQREGTVGATDGPRVSRGFAVVDAAEFSEGREPLDERVREESGEEGARGELAEEGDGDESG